MKHDYIVEFTPLAREIAKRHYTLDRVEAVVREEVDAVEVSKLEDLIFHTLAVDGSIADDDTPKFVCFPAKGRPGVLMVDSCTFEDTGEKVDRKGTPLDGKSIVMPRRDSDAD